jgi:Flp pilus assembly pilin Flp
MLQLLPVATLKLRASLKREEGQAMVEYALILGLVSVVAIVSLGLVGTNVNAILDEIQGQLADALP